MHDKEAMQLITIVEFKKQWETIGISWSLRPSLFSVL